MYFAVDGSLMMAVSDLKVTVTPSNYPISIPHPVSILVATLRNMAQSRTNVPPLSPQNASTSSRPSLERKASNSWKQWDILSSEWDILMLSTALKILLFPS